MSTGGWIRGAQTVSIEAAGDCRCGFPLYSIDGGSAEHIVGDDMQWRYRLGMLECVDQFGYFQAGT
jgi:hypothetical protein